MDCIVPIWDSREFKRSKTKYMHCIVPSESRGVHGFDKSLAKSMLCIVPCKNREVEGF